MSDPRNNPEDQQNGEVEDIDAPEAEEDVTSGGAPDEPDTPDHVYGGGA